MRYHVVIPAAGAGRRFAASQPKQYAPLAGSTVMGLALRTFASDADCVSITVAIAAGDPWWPAVALEYPRVMAVPGGAERAHSVRNALRALASHVRADDWVLVHDAARPCLSFEDLAALKRVLGEGPCGALLAIPLADTLKRGSGEPAEVVDTLDRAHLWRAATPQAFRFGDLLMALDAALDSQRVPTDEAQAMEWAGHRPRLVVGRPDNIKVTTPADLGLAAAILHTRGT